MVKVDEDSLEVESKPRLVTFPDIKPKFNGFNIFE